MTQNNFTIPSASDDSAWKSAAIEAQAEEGRAARALGTDQVDAPRVRRPIIHTAAYKAGRSDAIRRGHATRKRMKRERDAAKRAQARKPR